MLPLVTALLVAFPPDEKPPFVYLPCKAAHILPETTTDESGYFALCEGKNGKVYVGTAAYGKNAYLVEYDPATGRQRIVLDTHQLCGLTATGYAAQAKIHTRNFVGPSGVIYLGSKQGYRKDGDTSEYPGGYVMTYDPATDKAVNLGMPYPKEGVIDVVADEGRGLIYVVTCEEQHWVLWEKATGKFRELDAALRLTPYATTLIDAKGRANAITKDNKLARFDPATGKVTVQEIDLDGKPWTSEKNRIPTWHLAADGKTAYLLAMSDATLLTLDLGGDATGPVKAKALTKMVEGENPDSRCALSLAPDGRVYALVRVDNKTGFGKGYLHHLARYDPKAGKTEDLGVITIANPDYFPLGKTNKPWTHGFHQLPDGTWTPLHAHMALIVCKDGTIYATVIYPFTLMRLEGVK